MITDMILRVSGTVDFTNQTVNKFQAVWEDSALVQPFSAESLEAFKQLYAQRNVDIKALLHMLGGTYTFVPGSPSSQKTVKDWTFLFDGRITRDDGTHGDFSAVYDAKGGSRVTGTSVYAEVRANSTYKQIVDDVLSSVATNVTIS